jgi:hypothetical protein
MLAQPRKDRHMPTRREFLLAAAATPLLAARARSQNNPVFSIKQDQTALTIQSPTAKPILTYHLKKPAGAKLPVDSACFFHPLHTPAGRVVTDLAPADHPHHRGVFLAFVETHTTIDGKKIDADFWGWGEPAPAKGRRIINAEVTNLKADAKSASFRATNHWRADDQLVLTENLTAAVRPSPPNAPPAWILDLAYTLTPAGEMTLSRWAFSGFCARTLSKTANPKLSATGPSGPISAQKHPNPSHVKPETDWPDAPWYAYELVTDAGAPEAGLAVVNHPHNPKTLWHNHRDVRMLNPCIVAPGDVKLTPEKPLPLRYTVVAYDGGTPVDLLNSLAKV